MTKKEFEQFIESFKEEPGEYSESELYLIGVAHKQLDKKDKNWNKLVKRLGVNKSGEAFRSWIKFKQSHDENFPLPVNNSLISSRTIDNLVGSDFDNKIKELYIQQTKTKDVLNAYRRTLRDEARIDSIKDIIKDCVNEMPNLQLTKHSENKNTNYPTTHEAVLLLSDLHIGVECNNFYNTYNAEIAKERLDRLADYTIIYCNTHKVNKLNILSLGDEIHGAIHLSARIEQQMDVISQVMTASELISQFLIKVLNNINCEYIVYRSCSDNHARLVADKTQHIEKENLGKLIDWYVEERLRDTKIVFAKDNLDYSLGYFTLLNGKKCVFSHGHLDSIDKSFQNFVGATKQFIDYGFLSHYHSEKVKTFQGYTVFVNGSVVGTEQYALSKRLFSAPSQKLIIFENDNILDISIDLSNKI